MSTAIQAATLRAQLRMRLWLKRVGLNLLATLAAITGAAGISVLAAVAVVACGGGGSNVASVGSGGTGSLSAFSEGTITGFGSVIVNGLRYDDSNASVSDEDGADRRGDLKLGMVVRVQGSINASGSATASSIMFDSESRGPVSAVDTASKTLTVLGQKVLLDANTVFDRSLPQGLADIRVGQVLEVHGFLNAAANTVQATQIELKLNNTSPYKLSGNVSNLQRASRTFQIGTETISYAGLGTPQVLDNGALVKLRLSPGANAGVWTATRVRGPDELPSDQRQTEVEGLVRDLQSTTTFSVGRVQVDARAADFPNGSTGLRAGARVEVRGVLAGGVLTATRVKLEDASSKRIELSGAVSAVDSNAKTFVLRGVTVGYGTAQFEKGGVNSVVNGVSVEVEGRTAPDSAVVVATHIKFKD